MNELTIIEKTEKTLQQRKEPVVFPIASNHRKDLRKMRDDNIGNLRHKLRIIREEKQEEFTKIYSADIEKSLKLEEKKIKKLNDDWGTILLGIKIMLSNRIQLEKKLGVKHLSLDHSYDGFNEDLEFKQSDYHRKYSIDITVRIEEITKNMFNDKFKKSFDGVDQKINQFEQMYEEAINFGDLEVVKKIYYMLKNSDNFFEKIRKLKV